MANYKLVTCDTCSKRSLYDIDTLPKDNRGRAVLNNCKREDQAGDFIALANASGYSPLRMTMIEDDPWIDIGGEG